MGISSLGHLPAPSFILLLIMISYVQIRQWLQRHGLPASTGHDSKDSESEEVTSFFKSRPGSLHCSGLALASTCTC